MIKNTQDTFKPKEKTFKWLGVLFVIFVLCIILELMLIVYHCPYQGFVVFVIACMIPVLLLGGVKCLAYKMDPDPVIYVTDYNIVIGKSKLPWIKIQDVELATAGNTEMLFFWKKDARDDRDMECLDQSSFDSENWQRLKKCVEKHHPITIKD